MMDSEEAWLFNHDEAREKTDVNDVLKTANSVCSLIGFKLGNSWETYVREPHKFPWANLYLTSLELKTTFCQVRPSESEVDELFLTLTRPRLGLVEKDLSYRFNNF